LSNVISGGINASGRANKFRWYETLVMNSQTNGPTSQSVITATSA
jgi:hypothetical protein